MRDVVYSELYALALLEPWRTGQGRPNALDPTWQGWEPPPCEGEIDWEPRTGWWICKECGHVSCLTSTFHLPIIRPFWFLLESLGFFFLKRTEQGCTLSTSLSQLMFLAGTTSRYAATTSPEQVGKYANNLVVR
jgi:hypothetical protein